MVEFIGVQEETRGKLKAVASGTLSNGDTVVVNSDGTVSKIAGTSVSSSQGSVTNYYAGETRFTGAAAGPDNKIIIVWRDGNNSDYITYVVGTVSGTSISFGSNGVITTSYKPDNIINVACDTSTGTVVAHWSTSSSGYKTVAAAGTLSGTSITWGSPVEVHNQSSILTDRLPNVVYDSVNDKFVFFFCNGGSSSEGNARVGSVSSNTITLGSGVTFENGSNALTSTQLQGVFDPDSGNTVFVYSDYSNSSYGTAVVGTVSGTSISFQTPVVFESAATNELDITYDSTNQKIVVIYRDQGNSLRGTYALGSISGTTLTFGTPAEIVQKRIDKPVCAFNETTGKVTVAFLDAGAGDQTDLITGEVSGNTMTWGTEDNITTARGDYRHIEAVGSATVTVWTNGSLSDYGQAIVDQQSYTSTNITSENYIGISSTTVADTETATIDIIGTTNNAQSGLTAGQKYYVQNDGTLSTTADDPSVLAGTALSATKLVVKT